ncbi:MAG: methionine adenosyltransferase domain-containing protein, partial [Desulfovermiculus sp.]
VREVFDLRPYYILERLNLKRPIFKDTSCYGHFGRENPNFSWEQTDAAQDLRTACKV